MFGYDASVCGSVPAIASGAIFFPARLISQLSEWSLVSSVVFSLRYVFVCFGHFQGGCSQYVLSIGILVFVFYKSVIEGGCVCFKDPSFKQNCGGVLF